jgi:GT2 family glycosyltransferase
VSITPQFSVKNHPLVSIIIVNYNGRDLLKACLASIYSQSFKDVEIILVDNGSQDGSGEYVKDSFPGVKVVSLPANIGFAGANVEGLKYARGEYILLINNDAEVTGDCIRNLMTAIESNPAIGICASKMIVHGTSIIDSAGDGFATNLKGFKRGEGSSSDIYSDQEYVFGACAGAALYRRRMIEEIGFFDEDFFLIHEDTDLNLRAQLAGWKVLYVPTAVVSHKVRSSIGNMSDTAIYYTLRNCEFVRIKNIPVPLLMRCLPIFIIGAIADFFFFALKHGKLRLYLKAKTDVLKRARIMFGKRREIMGLKKVDNNYLRSILTPVSGKEFFQVKAKKFFSE